MTLNQTFEREGKYLTHKAGRYGHAKQFRRMRKVIKRQGTIVGRLSREIARKANLLSEAVQEALMQPLGRANRIQDPPYESGTKVGIATTARQNLIVGAKSF